MSLDVLFEFDEIIIRIITSILMGCINKNCSPIETYSEIEKNQKTAFPFKKRIGQNKFPYYKLRQMRVNEIRSITKPVFEELK